MIFQEYWISPRRKTEGAAIEPYGRGEFLQIGKRSHKRAFGR